MTDIVIIGTGLAGYTFAKEMRKIDKDCGLVLVTSDDGVFYSKPMLSNAIEKKKEATQLATATASQMAEQLRARIITDAELSAIDVHQKSITLASKSSQAESITFDELVLCVGAEQRDAGLGTPDFEKVYSVNNLTEYSRFRTDLVHAKHIAIVGTGLIGCEFANDIVSISKKVSVIGPGETPLANILPAQIGHYVADKLAQVGVDWHLGAKATALQSDGDEMLLRLTNGTTICPDLIMTAIGLSPRTELARVAGINVNKGIIVDNYLQTNIANIHALGDCAEINGRVLPFVLPIMQCARVLAANINATNNVSTKPAEPEMLSLPHMPIIVKTPACKIVALPPQKSVQGEWQISFLGDDIKGQFIDEHDQLQGFVLTGSSVSERPKLMKQLPRI